SSGRQVHRGRVEISLRSFGHLAGDQQIDLTPMVFIISEAFVNLSFREVRKTLRRQTVNSLTRLQESNDVVNANPCAFHSCISASNTRRTNDVAVGFRD